MPTQYEDLRVFGYGHLHPHVFRGTRQMAMRAMTSGTSTRKPGFLFDADLHGPHTYGDVMVPVVGEAACASAYAVS